MALKRIAQEYEDLQRDPLETCSARPAENGNLRQWTGYITGPPDTPYGQREFSIAIVFPDSYPMKPFKLSFTTPISHPNVSEDGDVRLAELEEKHWSPVLTVRSILICVQALLSGLYHLKGVGNSNIASSYSTNNPQEHGIGFNATQECIEPTHHGKRIGGKTYGMDMSRPEFEEYMSLTGEERDKFFVKNADVVRDL